MLTQVINNRRSLIQCQLPPKGKDTSGVLVHGECVTLIPGLNLVESEKLKLMRKNDVFDALFSTMIESSPAPETDPETVGKAILVQGQEVPDQAPLAKLQSKQCEAMIAETFSSGMLKNWLKEEGRPEIRRLLDSQLEKLEKVPSPANAGH